MRSKLTRVGAYATYGYLMQIFRDAIAQLLEEQLQSSASSLSAADIDALLEWPADDAHGDFAFPCFSLAKLRRQAPPAIAKELADGFVPERLQQAMVERVEVVGGYLNFFLNHEKVAEQVLRTIHEQRDAYGAADTGRGKRLVIEYSSPNIAKPFGIGHLRSTIIGQSLARMFTFLNYQVTTLNYLGDWGTQFGRIICAYKRWGKANFLRGEPITNLYKLYVRFHEEEKEKPELADEARQWFRRLEEGDIEALELWEWFRDLTMTELKGIYSTFNIQFDQIQGESLFTDKMPATIERLKDKGLLEESDGAQVVFLGDGRPPALITKSDGSTLYLTRDLAAAESRFKEFDFDHMLYVVGLPQAAHFEQIKAVLAKMDHEWASRIEHVGFGHLSLQDSGSMSTRSGNIIFLKDVLERAVKMASDIIEEKNPDLKQREKVATQVAIGALIYADFSSKRRKDAKFIWDEILNFDGETGPYLQYTSVRIRSLLEKFTGTLTDNVEYAKIVGENEMKLLKHLGVFEQQVVLAVEEREPFYLATYAMELAKRYNAFYHHCRVLDQDGELSLARVLLTYSSSVVLDSCLKLLGIPIPERM